MPINITTWPCIACPDEVANDWENQTAGVTSLQDAEQCAGRYVLVLLSGTSRCRRCIIARLPAISAGLHLLHSNIGTSNYAVSCNKGMGLQKHRLTQTTCCLIQQLHSKHLLQTQLTGRPSNPP